MVCYGSAVYNIYIYDIHAYYVQTRRDDQPVAVGTGPTATRTGSAGPRSLGRARVVGLGVQAHVTVVLAVHEPSAGRRVVVHHPPYAERVHVAEAAGARVAPVVRLFLVIVTGQIVLEAVPDERHAVVFGPFRRRPGRSPGGQVHHLPVRRPERVRPQRLFVQRPLFRGRGRRDRGRGGRRRRRRRATSVRPSRVFVAVSVIAGGRDRVDVDRPHGIVVGGVGGGRRCAARLRSPEL